MSKPRALTVSETCARLGLSKPTTLKYLKRGDIPGVKIGHSWRMSAQAIENLLCGGNGGTEKKTEERKAA